MFVAHGPQVGEMWFESSQTCGVSEFGFVCDLTSPSLAFLHWGMGLTGVLGEMMNGKSVELKSS